MNEQLPSIILFWYWLNERLISFPVFVLKKTSFITLCFTMIFFELHFIFFSLNSYKGMSWNNYQEG